MMSEEKTKVPWLCSCRVALALVGFWGFANLYALRVNMSVAMVCMINQTAIQKVVHSNNSLLSNDTDEINGKCLRNEAQGNSTDDFDKEDGEFAWSKQMQGLALGAFFWGYFVTQVPGGWLAAKFGGKRIFGWFMFVCAASTILMPVGARVSPIFLIVLRCIAGIGQGVVWPAMHAVWAYWAPPLERSKLIGFTFAGAQIGNVVTFPIAGLLCEYGFDNGWPSIFYLLGAEGILWFIFWMVIVHDTPEQHPRISQVEKYYIQGSLTGQTSKKIDQNVKIPWASLFKSAPVWAIIITHTCGNWTVYTFLTNMPTYMKEVLKFDIKANGLISAVPYIGMWAMTVISGFVADTLREKGIMNTTKVRKLNNIVGMLIPAVLSIILGFLDCTQWILAVIIMSIAVSLLGCVYGAGYVVNHADIAPKYSSLLFGLSNTAATIPGFMAPYVIGVLTTHQTQQEWRTVFFIAAAITSFGSIFFAIFGSGEIQPWAVNEDALEEDIKQNGVTTDPSNDVKEVEQTKL